MRELTPRDIEAVREDYEKNGVPAHWHNAPIDSPEYVAAKGQFPGFDFMLMLQYIKHPEHYPPLHPTVDAGAEAKTYRPEMPPTPASPPRATTPKTGTTGEVIRVNFRGAAPEVESPSPKAPERSSTNRLLAALRAFLGA